MNSCTFRDPVLKSNTEIILEEYIIRMTASGMKLASIQTTFPNAPLALPSANNLNQEVIEIPDDPDDSESSAEEDLDLSGKVSDECRPETPVIYYGDCGVLSDNGSVSGIGENYGFLDEYKEAPGSPLLVPIRSIDYDLDKILYPTPSMKPRGRPRKNPIVVRI